MADKIITYKPPGPVARAFMQSNAFIRSIMGPIGSGKSVTCVVEILRRAQLQAKAPDGKRHTRWAVVRNTYPDLKGTTLKTWLDWCPASFGKLNMSTPIKHHIVTDEIDLEVIFLALDLEVDVRKLMSLELTGVFFNEARYISKSILDAATGRVGRYPAVKDGGCTWAGVICDSNPPDDSHWIYRLAEGTDTEMVEQTKKLEAKMRQDGTLQANQPLMEFFKQPAGDGPEAENIPNLRAGYYDFSSVGKSQDYINVYVRGNYGFVVEGKPVYPNFRDSMHTAKEVIEPLPGIPILVGADFGLTPAAVFAQRTASGRWLILSELILEDCGITRFGEKLLAHKALHYPDHEIGGAWGDPAGSKRGPDEEKVFDILNLVTNWTFRAAPTNTIDLRLEAVKLPLDRLIDGLPAVLVSPNCMVLRKGFVSGYHYRLVASSNGAAVHETPDKNSFSHVHDACQYLFLGGGEYRHVLGLRAQGAAPRPSIAQGVGEDPFGRAPSPPSSVQYTNEKSMREWRDNRGKPKQTLALGTDDEVY